MDLEVVVTKLVRQQVVVAVVVLVTFNGAVKSFDIVLFLLWSTRTRKYWIVVEAPM